MHPAILRTSRADVRFGSKADMCAAIRHVRFYPNSDRKRRHGHYTAPYDYESNPTTNSAKAERASASAFHKRELCESALTKQTPTPSGLCLFVAFGFQLRVIRCNEGTDVVGLVQEPQPLLLV
jgi:hypothetical protein